jgi:hypothetical protein
MFIRYYGTRFDPKTYEISSVFVKNWDVNESSTPFQQYYFTFLQNKIDKGSYICHMLIPYVIPEPHIEWLQCLSHFSCLHGQHIGIADGMGLKYMMVR